MKHALVGLFLLPFLSVHAQLLKGFVKDSTGVEIPFARIGIAKSSYGTIANAEGKFQLKVPPGWVVYSISSPDYETVTDSIQMDSEDQYIEVTLKTAGIAIEEVIITSRTKRDRAKEIMKEVIDRREKWENALASYNVNLYSFTSLEQQIKDSIRKDSVISKKKLNITELYTHSYFQHPGKYKDSILGLIDLSEKAPNTGSVSVSFGTSNEPLQPQNAEEGNPYLFVKGLQDADVNLFKNQQLHASISQRPLISPLAYNAFLYYSYSLNQSFYREDGKQVYEIQVIPRFKEEALFEGRLYILGESYELVSVDLTINKAVLNYFKELHMLCDYETINQVLVPTRREFAYLLKEGRKTFNGQIRLTYTHYRFENVAEKSKFWLSTQVSSPTAGEMDSVFWNSKRTVPLKPEELAFIHQQDSITDYYESEAYLKQQDSTFNTLSVWDFLLNGVGFRNTFKKQEIYFDGLINQIIPFGVGGYRHRLGMSYDKEFKNGKKIHIRPVVDYGFRNKDFKRELNTSYQYNTMRFSKISFMVGDIYDLMNSYQSIQGTLAPANRVRNKKFEISHSFEVINGLYLKTGIFYSNRQSITGITYPDWVSAFGNFAQSSNFEGYRIFMTEIDFEYHFHQKYLLKQNRKIIVGSQWPVVNLTYKKGLPHFFGGQSDFDYLELRLHDQINLKTLGKSEVKLTAGTFVRKNNLHLVEHKFFRTSDAFFFSNPVNSLQLLDTALNTANSYLQLNFIHHFEGCFLNKIWGINRLKLQETVGGNFLTIPDAHFAQAELYAGLERQFRIKKQLFKLGVYAVTADSSFDQMKLTYKIGMNFYNSFYKKWDY